MNADDLKSWLAIALGIIAILGHAKGFFSSGEKKIAEDVAELETKTKEHDLLFAALVQRTQAVESELRHLPDKDTVNKLQVDMTDLKGQINLIMKSSEATERATRRVEEFLLRPTKE